MHKLITATILLSTLAFIAGLPATSQDLKMVAPKPPDAVEADISDLRDIPGGGGAGFTRVFHTPLSVEEAVAFYNRQIGNMTEIEKGINYRADIIEINFKQLGVLKVYDIPRRPGITVKSVRSLKQRNCFSDYFKSFRDMANSLEHYTRKDFNDLCERFGYLELAYYGYSDRTGADGKQLTRDEVLYREYVKKLDPDAGKIMTAEELVIEAQRLMEQGRMDEAKAVLEKAAHMQQEGMQHMMKQDIEQLSEKEKKPAKDNWSEWLEFFKELDTMIYPAIVFIDVHPSNWPDDEWLHESIEW